MMWPTFLKTFVAAALVGVMVTLSGCSFITPTGGEADTPERRVAKIQAAVAAGMGIIDEAFPEVKERARNASYGLFKVLAGLQDAPLTLDQLAGILTIAIAASGHPVEAAIAKKWLNILRPALMLYGLKSDGRVNVTMLNALGQWGMQMIDDNRALDRAIEDAKKAEAEGR